MFIVKSVEELILQFPACSWFVEPLEMHCMLFRHIVIDIYFIQMHNKLFDVMFALQDLTISLC